MTIRARTPRPRCLTVRIGTGAIADLKPAAGSRPTKGPFVNDTERIDMSSVLHFLDEIRDRLCALDGTPFDVQNAEVGRIGRSRNAKRGREMLYAAHLADCLRLEIEGEYWRFKGLQPPVTLPAGASGSSRTSPAVPEAATAPAGSRT